jgi:hypothetical protein
MPIVIHLRLTPAHGDQLDNAPPMAAPGGFLNDTPGPAIKPAISHTIKPSRLGARLR